MLDIVNKTFYDDLDFSSFSLMCQKCSRCELSNYRQQVVVGSGLVPSSLMFVGEGPGAEEDKTGKPFVGRSGKLLIQLMDMAGIDRESSTYITNIVKCRPPENRTPLKSEIDSCKSLLIRQIQLVQPSVLVVIGAPSLKTVLHEKQPISKVRGNWYEMEVGYMDEPLKIMPIFHPSYLLRNARYEEGTPRWLTVHDLIKVFSYLQDRSA